MSSPSQTGTPAQTQPASATVRANAAAATAAAGGGQGKCDFCSRVGLPILPLRYAAVPSYLPGSVTDPIGWQQLGASLKSQHPEALKGHRYALRTLRKGYVMVYLGSGLWHGYVVSAGGHLRKLADIDDPDFKNDREMSPACKRAGHNIPASFITIPPIARGGTRMLPTKVWIAFSDALWTRDIRKQYEDRIVGTSTKPGVRLQSFTIDALGKQADGVADAFQLSNDEAATAQRLNGLVVEYAADVAQAGARTHYETADPYDPKKRNRAAWESAHGIGMRTGEAQAVAKHAAKLTPSNHDMLMASAVVLDDPVGMVQELNATRLAIVENRQRYLSDPRIARPLLISQSIMGLKSFISEQERAEALAKLATREQGRPDIQTTFEPVTYDDRGQPNVPYSQSIQTEEGLYYRKQTTREERAAAEAKRAATQAGNDWASMQEHYRESERTAFEKNVASTLKTYQDWLVKTDADYAQWLEHPHWFQCCRACDPEDAEQQVTLLQILAAALCGGPTSAPAPDAPSGQAPQDTHVYEVWKKFFDMRPNDEANPVYVALFGFRQEILDYLLPDGVVPGVSHLDKGHKLFKLIKSGFTPFHWTNEAETLIDKHGLWGAMHKVADNTKPNPLRSIFGAAVMNNLRSAGRFSSSATAAVMDSLLAISSASNLMSVQAMSDTSRAIMVRAIQGVALVYERREIYLGISRQRLREYVANLNDFTFNATDAAILHGAKGVQSVAQVGKSTVRSMAVAGVLRIRNEKVADAFIDVVHWVDDKLDGVIETADAAPARRQVARQTHADAQAAAASQTAAMGGHPAPMGPEGVTRLKALKPVPIVNSGMGLMAVVGLVLNCWAAKESLKNAEATLVSDAEARLVVGSSVVAVVGALVETYGVGLRAAGAKQGWWLSRYRLGAVIGAASAFLDSIQQGIASARSYRHGDIDASVLHGATSTFLLGAAVFGIWSSVIGAAIVSLPFIGAIVFFAGAMVLGYFAKRAEDSQTEIWLSRCYWGKGVWKDEEIDQELSQLNALFVGLSAEVGFEDHRWASRYALAEMSNSGDSTPQAIAILQEGTKWVTVKEKITFPYFTPKASAYKWQLRAVGKSRGDIVLASGEHQTVPDDPFAATGRDKAPKNPIADAQYVRNLDGPNLTFGGPKNDVLVVKLSVNIQIQYFSDVVLAVEYVADLSDPHARASLLLREEN